MFSRTKRLVPIALSTSLLLAPSALAQTSTQLIPPTNLSAASGTIHDVSMTPDATLGISNGATGVDLIDVESGAVLGSYQGATTPYTAGNTMSNSVEATDIRAIAVGIVGDVVIFDISQGALTFMSADTPMLGINHFAKDVTITPDGTRAIVVYHQAATRIYDLITGTLITTLPGAGASYGAVPSLDGVETTNTHAVAIGSTIKVYDVASTPPVEVVIVGSIPTEIFYDVSISPNGSTAAIAADNSGAASDTQILSLSMTGGVPSASVIASFPGPGSADRFISSIHIFPNEPPVIVPRLVGFLEEMVAVTDSNVVVLGINPLGTTVNGNVHVIDLAVTPPVLTDFPIEGILHDMAFNESGTKAVVHSSENVYVFDLSLSGTPLLNGPPLASPGSGLVEVLTVFANGSFFGREFYIENSVRMQEDRAILIGHSFNFFQGPTSSRVSIYDLESPSGGPALIQTHSSFGSSTIPHKLKEVALSPSGEIAAVIAGGNSIGTGSTRVFEMATGNQIASLSAPTGNDLQTVHALEMSDSRVLSIGNRNQNFAPVLEPQYSLGGICQLPFNSGTPLPNSSGLTTNLSHIGSTSISQNDMSIIATGLPNSGGAVSTFGVLSYSFGVEAPRPLNDGLLYLSAPLYRTIPVNITSDPFTIKFDHALLTPSGVIIPSQLVHFQLWYRDNTSSTTANLSDVYSICFGQ